LPDILGKGRMMDIVSFDLRTNEPVQSTVADDAKLPAWQEVEPGRFRPRRIRGSFLGRELG